MISEETRAAEARATEAVAAWVRARDADERDDPDNEPIPESAVMIALVVVTDWQDLNDPDPEAGWSSTTATVATTQSTMIGMLVRAKVELLP